MLLLNSKLTLKLAFLSSLLVSLAACTAGTDETDARQDDDSQVASASEALCSSVTAVSSNPRTVTVTFKTSSSSSDIAGYRVWRDSRVIETLQGGSGWVEGPFGSTLRGTGIAFDGPLASGSTHTYQISVFDRAGNESVKSCGAVVRVR